MFFPVTTQLLLWSCLNRRKLVGARKNGAGRGRLATMNASAGAARANMAQDCIWLERNAAHGRARFFLNCRFAFGVATPGRVGEAGFDCFLEFFVGLGFVRICAAKGEGLIKQCLLDFSEQLFDGYWQVGERSASLPFPARAVASRQHGCLLGDVLWAQLDPQ